MNYLDVIDTLKIHYNNNKKILTEEKIIKKTELLYTNVITMMKNRKETIKP